MQYRLDSAQRYLEWAVIAVAAMILGGCAVGPTYVSPNIEVTESFHNGHHAELLSRSPEASWWQGFEDPLVSQLINDALTENHNIKIARVNIVAARADLRQAELNAFPRVTARASVKRTQKSVAESPRANGTLVLYEAGFDARWELDFFGRVAASRAASMAEYEAAVFDRRAVAVVVAAEVARRYIELRGAQNELAVLRRNAAIQRQTFELAGILASAGRGTDLDVARAGAQLQATHADIPPLEEEVAQAIHRLGLLTGRQPSALNDILTQTGPIPAVPETLAIGTPQSLLRRRADVRYAERRLAAATERHWCGHCGSLSTGRLNRLRRCRSDVDWRIV